MHYIILANETTEDFDHRDDPDASGELLGGLVRLHRSTCAERRHDRRRRTDAPAHRDDVAEQRWGRDHRGRSVRRQQGATRRILRRSTSPISTRHWSGHDAARRSSRDRSRCAHCSRRWTIEFDEPRRTGDRGGRTGVVRPPRRVPGAIEPRHRRRRGRHQRGTRRRSRVMGEPRRTRSARVLAPHRGETTSHRLDSSTADRTRRDPDVGHARRSQVAAHPDPRRIDPRRPTGTVVRLRPPGHRSTPPCPTHAAGRAATRRRPDRDVIPDVASDDGTTAVSRQGQDSRRRNSLRDPGRRPTAGTNPERDRCDLCRVRHRMGRPDRHRPQATRADRGGHSTQPVGRRVATERSGSPRVARTHPAHRCTPRRSTRCGRAVRSAGAPRRRRVVAADDRRGRTPPRPSCRGRHDRAVPAPRRHPVRPQPPSADRHDRLVCDRRSVRRPRAALPQRRSPRRTSSRPRERLRPS